MIYKQTGLSYKPKFTNALKELEKENIVRREKDPKHKQREFILLTDLGFELAEFKKRLDDYISSYWKLYELKEFVLDVKELEDESAIKNKLSHRGWNDEEISWFDYTFEGIRFMTATADMDIFDSFLYRYYLLLSKFTLGEISKLIIHSLIIEVTDFKVANIIGYIKESDEERIENYTSILENQIYNITQFAYIFPTMFYDAVKSNILARLYLLKSPKSIISKELKEIEDYVNSLKFKKVTLENAKNEDRLASIRLKCLKGAYKEYLSEIN